MLTKIGNSQGIRIPKPIIKQAKLENTEIVFEVTKNGLLLKPVKKVSRKTWKKNIKEVISRHNHEDEAILQEWLNEELDGWEW